MVMKYAQSNVVASYFERWKQYNANRIVKRRKDKLIVQYYQQQQLAGRFRTWRRFTKEQRSKRRRGKRAMAYLRSSTAIKSLRRWREFVAKSACRRAASSPRAVARCASRPPPPLVVAERCRVSACDRRASDACPRPRAP